MFVRAPLMETHQDRAICINYLSKVAVSRTGRSLAKERLVPPEAGRHIPYAEDRPCTFHPIRYSGICLYLQVTRYQTALTAASLSRPRQTIEGWRSHQTSSPENETGAARPEVSSSSLRTHTERRSLRQ